MKRCNRHFYPSNDVYTEFHFERSLRKYEVCPQKKIKLRSFVCSPAANHRVMETTKNIRINSKRREDQRLSLNDEGIEVSFKCEDDNGKLSPSLKGLLTEKEREGLEQASSLNSQDKEIDKEKVGTVEKYEMSSSIKAGQSSKPEIVNLDKRSEDYF